MYQYINNVLTHPGAKQKLSFFPFHLHAKPLSLQAPGSPSQKVLSAASRPLKVRCSDLSHPENPCPLQYGAGTSTLSPRGPTACSPVPLPQQGPCHWGETEQREKTKQSAHEVLPQPLPPRTILLAWHSASSITLQDPLLNPYDLKTDTVALLIRKPAPRKVAFLKITLLISSGTSLGAHGVFLQSSEPGGSLYPQGFRQEHTLISELPSAGTHPG